MCLSSRCGGRIKLERVAAIICCKGSWMESLSDWRSCRHSSVESHEQCGCPGVPNEN